jgi:hypothetical protein
MVRPVPRILQHVPYRLFLLQNRLHDPLPYRLIFLCANSRQRFPQDRVFRIPSSILGAPTHESLEDQLGFQVIERVVLI